MPEADFFTNSSRLIGFLTALLSISFFGQSDLFIRLNSTPVPKLVVTTPRETSVDM